MKTLLLIAVALVGLEVLGSRVNKPDLILSFEFPVVIDALLVDGELVLTGPLNLPANEKFEIGIPGTMYMVFYNGDQCVEISKDGMFVCDRLPLNQPGGNSL